jgi:ParB family chromosome partitioning protein
MEMNNQIVKIPIENIIPNRFQPRQNFKEEDLSDLASSVKQYGIIQPLIVRPMGDKFEIIAGERRYRAATMVGLKTVPAIINDINDQTSAELAIVENIQRQNLNAVEEAKSYKRLLDLGQMTQEQLAERMGKKQATIANKIRLLNLPQEVQNAVLEGKISERHARSLLTVTDPNFQKEILNKIISEKLTVKATEALIKENQKTDNNINKVTNSEPTINLSKLNNPTISKNNIYKITGDDNMNQPNYNDLMQQSATPIPETPIPEPNIVPPKNSIFNNNFFPSLDDEKTNMNNLNSLSINNLSNNVVTEPIESSPTMSLNQFNQNQTETNNQSLPNEWNQVVESVNTPSQTTILEPNNQMPQNPWNIPTVESTSLNNIQEEVNSNIQTPSTPLNIQPESIVSKSESELSPLAYQNNQPQPWTITTEQPSSLNNHPEEIHFNIESQPNPWNIQTEQIRNNNWNNSSTSPIQDSTLNSSIEPNIQPSINPWNIPNEQVQNNAGPELAPLPETNMFNQPNPWNNQNISNLPNFIEQPLPSPINQNNIMPEVPTQEPALNINDAVNKIRQVINEIEVIGYKVQSSEIDMDNEYQITIKIQKAN